jgi:hypothetical protein
LKPVRQALDYPTLYFLAWLVIVGGLFVIYRIVRRLERELQEVKRKLDSTPNASP